MIISPKEEEDSLSLKFVYVCVGILLNGRTDSSQTYVLISN